MQIHWENVQCEITVSHFLITLGLDLRLQTGLSKQHTWDFITVKSGCFKHPFKIYLHLKKPGCGRICQGKDHPAACCVLQLYIPNHLLQAAIWEQVPQLRWTFGVTLNSNPYIFMWCFNNPKKKAASLHSTRGCDSNTVQHFHCRILQHCWKSNSRLCPWYRIIE